MLSYCTDYLATMPDITVYMNCDTYLAINLKALNLGENDEFIFTIKNYDHIDSPYVFLFRARLLDMDKNGEVIFRIDPDVSKKIKPDAFYNFTALTNAFNKNELTGYKKLTNNGRILVEYGAHDLALPVTEENTSPFSEVSDVRLEVVDENTPNTIKAKDVIVGISLEEAE